MHKNLFVQYGVRPMATCLKIRILSSVVSFLFFIFSGFVLPQRLTHQLAQIPWITSVAEKYSEGITTK